MIRREASRYILAMSKVRPVLVISGPYQSGKTTLVRKLFPGHRYVSLSASAEARELARASPRDFLARCAAGFGGGIIIDEFRLAPELSGAIRAATAGNLRPGRFILVSSLRPQKSIVAPASTEKLASATLLPLTIGELVRSGVRLGRDGYIHGGFMPHVYCISGHTAGEHDAQRQNYRAGYLERCVSRLIVTGSHEALGRFMSMLAGRVGQAVNFGTYAEAVGVSTTTIMSWVTALETGFIIFRLPCYPGGLGERVMKTPKLYFTDVGLAAHLLGIKNDKDIQRHPQVGNLFENMVVAEALKNCRNRGKNAELYYFRSRSGLEIDLIVKIREDIIPIEIKCGASYCSTHGRNIEAFRKLSAKIREGYVVYNGSDRMKEKGAAEYVNYCRVGELMF